MTTFYDVVTTLIGTPSNDVEFIVMYLVAGSLMVIFVVSILDMFGLFGSLGGGRR